MMNLASDDDLPCISQNFCIQFSSEKLDYPLTDCAKLLCTMYCISAQCTCLSYVDQMCLKNPIIINHISHYSSQRPELNECKYGAWSSVVIVCGGCDGIGPKLPMQCAAKSYWYETLSNMLLSCY